MGISPMGNGTDISPDLADATASSVPTTVRLREHAAVRNVSLLLVLRGAILAGGVATAALVPRTLGPATYGRYDLITMLTFWFTMLGGLGMGQVVSRQTPQLEAEGAIDKLRSLFSHLLAVRFLSGAFGAFLYFLIMGLWLRELDRSILLVLSVVVLVRVPGALCYSLFLGQGRIGRWAVPEVIRQWGSVTFALPLFLLAGLHGAVIGYLLSETLIFVVGIVGARHRIAWRSFRPDFKAVAPYLKIGMAFFAGDVILSAIERSGAVLVRSVTLDYAQVGMFSVSYQVFMAAVLATHQISASFVSIITVLRARQEHAELSKWIERLVKWLSLLSVLAFLGSLLLGKEIVPMVLGRAYASAVPNVIVLAATLLLLPLVQVGSLLSLTHDRPDMIVMAAATRLGCFWAVGVSFVGRWGSLGACCTVFLAIMVQAAYFAVKHRALIGPAFRRWLFVVVTGLGFMPLVLLRGSAAVNVALYLLAAGGYLMILRSVGVISARELQTVYRALGAAKLDRRGGKGAA